jgi:hypothetical protein
MLALLESRSTAYLLSRSLDVRVVIDEIDCMQLQLPELPM